MTDRFGIDKAEVLMVMFVSVLSFLSACSPTLLVCMSGVCPSSKGQMTQQIPWDPPSLNQKNCNNISGKYKPKIYKSDFTSDELMRKFPQSNDQFGFIHVKLEGQKTPERWTPRPSKENPNRMIWDAPEFYNSAYVLIQQSEQELSASLIGSDGKLYRKQTIALDSPMIGCGNGDFIIRTLFVPHGGEMWGAAGWASAIERRFRKLADGSLQVTTYDREWNYDLVLGVAGTPRKEGRYTLTFEAVP